MDRFEYERLKKLVEDRRNAARAPIEEEYLSSMNAIEKVWSLSQGLSQPDQKPVAGKTNGAPVTVFLAPEIISPTAVIRTIVARLKAEFGNRDIRDIVRRDHGRDLESAVISSTL